MKTMRRLVLMVAGLMVLCSGSLAWINGQMPINASFGAMLSQAITTIFGGSVTISIALLNQISMAAVLFVVGVIILVAAVLGSRAIAIVGAAISALIVAMWIIATNISLDGLINNFTRLGAGTNLVIISIVTTLLVVLLPKLHKPSKSAE